MRRPQNFAKSSHYFWLALHRTKVRWRFRKILPPSQNIWTLIVYQFREVGMSKILVETLFLKLFNLCTSYMYFQWKIDRRSQSSVKNQFGLFCPPHYFMFGGPCDLINQAIFLRPKGNVTLCNKWPLDTDCANIWICRPQWGQLKFQLPSSHQAHHR